MEGFTDHEKELARANGGQTASLVQQLHSLIRLLQSRPELPLSKFGSTSARYFAASPREVDAIAAALMVAPAWNKDRTHYTARYPLGENVAYEAVFITPARRKAYDEHMAAFPQARPELAVA